MSSSLVVVAFLATAFAGALLRAVITDLDAPFNRQLWATLAINVAGAFLLGVLHDSAARPLAIIGVGGLGAFTTFSTFIAQVECIDREGKRRDAALYVVASVTLGISAGWVGSTLG